jgi:glycosyltransferase involved in cell wall biosynthesis
MTDIAFFLVNLDGGGAEKVMLTLAGGFAEKGFKVDLVLVKLEGEYLSLISPKVRVINLARSRLIASLLPLIQYLKQNQPKVLISALEDPNTLSIIAKILARVSTRLIITVHNPLSLNQQSNQLKRKLTPFFVRWLFPFADEIVSVSQGVADGIARISRLPPKNIKVIYNPIFMPNLIEKINEPIDFNLLIKEEVSFVLGIGRLSKEKDFSTLINAFAIVQKQYPLELIILGQGPELSNLQLLVKKLNLVDKVAFLGFVNNPYPYMAKAKMLVMTSVLEGFGNVLVEGMIVGTPVVSTDCESGPSEILANGKYGHLVDIGDIQGLAIAMIDTLKNPLDPEFLKKRGREFSLEAALTKYQQLFNLS